MAIGRALNRIYARLFGYFWLPCPVCAEPFGGHEASMTGLIVDEADGQHCYCTCYKLECQQEAMRRNAQRPPAVLYCTPEFLELVAPLFGPVRTATDASANPNPYRLP